MNPELIIQEWKKGIYHPVYWLEGEESYYIDQLIDYAEKHILNESEASFNLSIFYGRDTKLDDVVNACKRYPMFSERQVVILKEAQHMKEVEKLEAYIDHPLSTTVFIVGHKEKKIDGRSKLAKQLKSKTVLLTTKKLYDNELPDWTERMIHQKGLDIQSKALQMLVDHIGNDLQRLENEVDKLTVNLQNRKQITEDDIESFVGVSKEFNIFELQAALGRRDMNSTLKILNYFEANPKVAPIQLVLPTLYSFFSKLYMAASSSSRDEYSIAALLGLKGFFAKQYIQAIQLYSFVEIEKALILLHHYNLKSIGIGKADTSDASLMKELAAKIILQD
ncbi:MAG: DNA polymerase III subunit delta [Chitinophagia bacterium]|nr:DNA polymerase III subunit delta [Chitinophagia bacterium]